MALYVAKYVPKFSDSFTEEYLRDDAGLSGDATAAGILCRYHPMEPEMALQIFAQQMPQWKIATEGGGSCDLLVPWPGQVDVPRRTSAMLEAYMQCSWRGEAMSFLEYLRKTDNESKGVIVQWLRRKHHETVEREGYELYKASAPEGSRIRAFRTWQDNVLKKRKARGEGSAMDLRRYLVEVERLNITAPDLETFARDYKTKGEKAVCCAMRSRLSDEFYGQWMVLHVPFRTGSAERRAHRRAC